MAVGGRQMQHHFRVASNIMHMHVHFQSLIDAFGSMDRRALNHRRARAAIIDYHGVALVPHATQLHFLMQHTMHSSMLMKYSLRSIHCRNRRSVGRSSRICVRSLDATRMRPSTVARHGLPSAILAVEGVRFLTVWGKSFSSLHEIPCLVERTSSGLGACRSFFLPCTLSSWQTFLGVV